MVILKRTMAQSAEHGVVLMERPETDRFDDHFPRLERLLRTVYGDLADSLLPRIIRSIQLAQHQRPEPMQALDQARTASPEWVTEAGNTVYTFYVDRFAGTLSGVGQRLDYLKHLGVRWLHPLPLLKPRAGDSDGGFAVEDYRAVHPALGTMDDLAALTAHLREEGIGVILDVVCNHTAREHEWAKRARAGDPAYRDYYVLEPDAAVVAAWETDLVDVFPDTAPGSFTWDDDLKAHVWTTFYPFQWDLNYANPVVFAEMLDVLLYLANQGIQGFRLDSAPFLWKRSGTNCRNQPEVYALVEAWRAALDIVAPGVILLAEAIESLDDVLPFFGDDETGCDLAYNNGVMTALWGGLADADAAIVRRVMSAALAKPESSAWLNYVRCHDDLIWNALSRYASADDLARWSDFYGGGGNGFSLGRAFQTAAGGVPSTNGMAAALVGLGAHGKPDAKALARLKLLYGVVHAMDGWPLIYMGDEIGLGNDEQFAADPLRRGDGRWLHRPEMNWALATAERKASPTADNMFETMRLYSSRARDLNGLGVQGPACPFDAGPPAVLAFSRTEGQRRLIVFANLSDQPVDLPIASVGGTDILTGRTVPMSSVSLAGYGLLWMLEDV